MTGQQVLQGQRERGAAPWLWWRREFPGTAEQASAVRRWLRQVLPQCDPCDDLIIIGNELAANAVRHTRSALPGAAFTVELAWSPGHVRVVVGDHGSADVPRVIHGSAGTSRRGLELVEALASTWGTTGDAGGRWVWADIAQPDGPRPAASAPGQPTAAQAAELMRSFPGIPLWFGGTPATWQALPPGSAVPVEAPSPGAMHQILIAAPSPGAIHQILTAARLNHGPDPAPAVTTPPPQPTRPAAGSPREPVPCPSRR